jgi:hypothetical protein
VRAFVVTRPGECSVRDVDAPSARPGEVVVDVARVRVCGTDVEFFTGEMAYLHDGHAAYPMRLGHEWCGAVCAVGDGVEFESKEDLLRLIHDEFLDYQLAILKLAHRGPGRPTGRHHTRFCRQRGFRCPGRIRPQTRPPMG